MQGGSGLFPLHLFHGNGSRSGPQVPGGIFWAVMWGIIPGFHEETILAENHSVGLIIFGFLSPVRACGESL